MGENNNNQESKAKRKLFTADKGDNSPTASKKSKTTDGMDPLRPLPKKSGKNSNVNSKSTVADRNQNGRKVILKGEGSRNKGTNNNATIAKPNLDSDKVRITRSRSKSRERIKSVTSQHRIKMVINIREVNLKISK